MSRLFLLLAALAVFAAACSSGDVAPPSTSTVAEAAAFPVTITTPTGDVTIQEKPQRIVSLSSTATESLFAISAGGQVVAVDDTSNYPEAAPITDLNGFTVTAESLATYDPDLVIYFFDPGDLAAGLETLGIPAVYQPAAVDLNDALGQIEQLGIATGNIDAATTLVAGMQEDIADIEASVTGSSGANYYYELGEELYSVTSSTFVGHLFGELGLMNIADPADPDGFGYPQLSSEFIIDVDPDLVFLADTKCCAQNAETLAARPGWDQLSALQNGAVVELDDDVASRWGPRVVDLLAAAAEAILTFELTSP